MEYRKIEKEEMNNAIKLVWKVFCLTPLPLLATT